LISEIFFISRKIWICPENFFAPKWYTDRNFFGDGVGGEVAENNFPKKDFHVKFENFVLSGRLTKHPPEAS
jgi:hypothetical protein